LTVDWGHGLRAPGTHPVDASQVLFSCRAARSSISASVARFARDCCAVRSIIARKTAETLAAHEPSACVETVSPRVVLAEVARPGWRIRELDNAILAAREITSPMREVAGFAA
jgi:chromosome partitioning protein